MSILNEKDKGAIEELIEAVGIVIEGDLKLQVLLAGATGDVISDIIDVFKATLTVGTAGMPDDLRDAVSPLMEALKMFSETLSAKRIVATKTVKAAIELMEPALEGHDFAVAVSAHEGAIVIQAIRADIADAHMKKKKDNDPEH